MDGKGRCRGIGICTTVLIVLVTLKLVGVIEWSWAIVLIPLWIQLGIMALCLIVIGICEVASRLWK